MSKPKTVNLEIKFHGNFRVPFLLSITNAALDELEDEYLRVGFEHCDGLRAKTQLAAFILAGIRALSLLRNSVHLLQADCLDAHSALHRAFEEAWLLQFTFRLKGSERRIQRWFSRPTYYKPDHGSIDRFLKKLTREQSDCLVNWRLLSSVSHPTESACQDSLLVVAAQHGLVANRNGLASAVEGLSKHHLSLFQAELWLSIYEHSHMIDTGFNPDALPTCQKFVGADLKGIRDFFTALSGPLFL